MRRSVAAVEQVAEPPTERRWRGGAGWWLLVVAVAAAAGAVAAVAVDIAGQGAFPTHPVSVLALGAASVAVWSATRNAPARSVTPLRALAVSLLAYQWLGVAACAVDDPVLAALWSAGWIPVNGLVVVVGLSVAAMPRSARAVAVVTAVVTAGAVGVGRPTRPFEGLPTAAPESWTTSVPWLADGLVTMFWAALVAASVGTVLRCFRAHHTERRRLASCAATTSMGPGLVLMCVALAALRDPGDIDPSTGSVGYLVAVALTGVLAAYGNAASLYPLRLVLGYWVVAVSVLVGVEASAVTPAAVGVGLTVLVASAATVGLVLAVVRIEQWSTVTKPRLITSVPLLSPRENEVLAAVAAGATNAGVAAQLFLSERTVEQHLRSIFKKLDFGDHDSSNRRVRAAAAWWQHQGQNDAQAVDRLA